MNSATTPIQNTSKTCRQRGSRFWWCGTTSLSRPTIDHWEGSITNKGAVREHHSCPFLTVPSRVLFSQPRYHRQVTPRGAWYSVVRWGRKERTVFVPPRDVLGHDDDEEATTTTTTGPMSTKTKTNPLLSSRPHTRVTVFGFWNTHTLPLYSSIHALSLLYSTREPNLELLRS